MFPAEGACVVDPCLGTGRALDLITEDAQVQRHGVELDASRAEAAKATSIHTIYGNVFNTTSRVESFFLLYLNPPYDSEIGTSNNRRMEYLFLDHTARWLVEGGVLIMVIPQERVERCLSLLAGDFTSLEVLRLTDKESERFKQVAVIGVRKAMPGKAYEANLAALQRKVYNPQMPELRTSSLQYAVPPSKSAALIYKGLPLNEIEDSIASSPV